MDLCLLSKQIIKHLSACIKTIESTVYSKYSTKLTFAKCQSNIYIRFVIAKCTQCALKITEVHYRHSWFVHQEFLVIITLLLSSKSMCYFPLEKKKCSVSDILVGLGLIKGGTKSKY